MKQRILILFFWAFLGDGFAQEVNYQPHFGGQIGLSFNFGSHLNRLGLKVQGYYAHQHFQVQTGGHFLYNFTSFGPKQARPEAQLFVGALVSYGPQDSLSNPFINRVSNQTRRSNSIAYSYNWYLEKLTPQPTGTLALQFGRIEIITENDALAGQGQDKFRTGTFQVAYRYQDSRLALNTILWTGDTHGEKTCRINEPGDYPCRYGYKDISKAHCGQYSHGILALQYQHYLGYQQTAQASMGIDAEQVRHFFQNKLIHDMPFWPRKWNKVHNPHLPMLDKNGAPYLFEEGQELKPTSWYLDLGLNAPLFY